MTNETKAGEQSPADLRNEQELVLESFIHAFDRLVDVLGREAAILCARQIHSLAPARRGAPKKQPDLYHGIMGLYDYGLMAIERGDLNIKKSGLVKWTAERWPEATGKKIQSQESLEKQIRRLIKKRKEEREEMIKKFPNLLRPDGQ